MDLFRRAKQAAKDAVSNVSTTGEQWLDERKKNREEGWRQQVLTEVPGEGEFPSYQFKPFQAWVDEFEPTAVPGDGGMIQQGVAHVKERARAALLAQIEKLLTDNVMKIILEASSKVFSPIEDQVRSINPDLAAVLNALNGVLLSYRFGLTGNAEQFEFLRGVAVEMLVSSVDALMANSPDPEQRLAELEQIVCEKVHETKEQVQAVVSDTPLFTLDSIQSDGNTTLVGVAKEAIEQNVDSPHVNQALTELQQFLKAFVLAQMDMLVLQVPRRVSQLVGSLHALRQSVDTPECISDPVLLRQEVERVHAHTRSKVTSVVSGIVKMLNAMMMPANVANDE
eukprot:TRINITY_DN8036_c0_g1_i2.p1 TRINITY_DN8036_c0_g1~~TRINITY_DN8036_c0_g1_i2.p1  ORF type:complete len:339 (+),score=113.20 TRINITY_DN8036_c0_g1_i2:231-1247(+)